MAGPMRIDSGAMDGGYVCSCGAHNTFANAEQIPPCSRCGLPADRFGLFAESFTVVVWPPGSLVVMDGGTLDLERVRRSERWRRRLTPVRRAWSWLRYRGWR